jgi:HD domain
MTLTVPVIRSHHEPWDGSGYPDGLKGEAIPLLARVFQIVDIFDALTSPRPYKPALSSDEVISILRQEINEDWLDPHLGAIFLNLLKTMPHDFNIIQAAVDGESWLREVCGSVAHDAMVSRMSKSRRGRRSHIALVVISSSQQDKIPLALILLPLM